MKTLFICAKCKSGTHTGEEYDEILYVENLPTIDNIQQWADVIGVSIRKLHSQDKANGGDGVVSVSLDAHMAFNGVLCNYQVILKSEGIEIQLPYLPKDWKDVHDKETLDVLHKFGEKQ